ncbi:MAG: hypothetical protein ACYDG3_14945 [Bacillati bacterium]
MPLNVAEAIAKGEDVCDARARYRITPEDLAQIRLELDRLDGSNPYLVFSADTVRREIAGGSRASENCLVWMINNKIKDDDSLRQYDVWAHRQRGNIRFDRNRPNIVENEIETTQPPTQ